VASKTVVVAVRTTAVKEPMVRKNREVASAGAIEELREAVVSFCHFYTSMALYSLLNGVGKICIFTKV
jgi:hypothetical protein